jgi:hypothetical protein
VTNVVLGPNVTSTTAYTTILSVASTITRGTVVIDARALYREATPTSPSLMGYRLFSVQGSTTNFITELHKEINGSSSDSFFDYISGYEVLTGTASTYVLQGKVDSAANDVWTSTNASASSASYTATNATYMRLLQIP